MLTDRIEEEGDLTNQDRTPTSRRIICLLLGLSRLLKVKKYHGSLE